MLSTTTARGALVSKCFLRAQVPTKRLASLTGAIARGSRKAREAGGRTGPYDSKPSSFTSTGFRSGETRGSDPFAPSEQQDRRKHEAENRQDKQRGPLRWEGRGSRRVKGYVPRAEGYGPSGRVALKEQERTSLPWKPSARESSSRTFGRHQQETRYFKTDDDRTALNRRPVERRSSGEEDRTPFSREPISRESSSRTFDRHQDDPRYPKTDGDRNRPNRWSAERPSSGEDDERSFSRKPISWESSSRTFDRHQDESRYPKIDGDRKPPTRWPAERLSSGEDDGRSFSRKASRPENSFRAGDRDRNGSGHLGGYEEKTAQNRWSAEKVSKSERDTKSFDRKPQAWEASQRTDKQKPTPEAEQATMLAKRRSAVPIAIPRSTAASEFIYGSSAVKAALQANTRKLYKLYVYQGASGTQERDGDREVLRLAHKRDLTVKKCGGDELPLLDKMSQSRPHNGYVLEASQLPDTPAVALESVTGPGEAFSFTAGHQSAEDLEVNGNSHQIPGSRRRYPFILMLDSILDPGNLGAIIRSAAFFGVDAVAVVDNSIAPFSSVTLKAASGAAEFMRYLKITKGYEFVRKSQSNGWKFYAAVAPASASASADRGEPEVVSLKAAGEALRKGPCVLMLGGEGEGLRPRFQKAADGVVGIQGAGRLKSRFGLDSLNVSVASALMMQTFLKGPGHHINTEVSAEETKPTEDGERLF
jgi:21S rRNA (GM2251-2'-O)-methyltransferase